uniref:DUF759 family protein n=2 Tax=Borreliella afzelii TaxID=29518 RepID=UPI00359C34AB
SSEVNKAKSDLANIEQTLQDLTNDVLQPVLGKVATILDRIKDFNFSNFLKDIKDSIKEGISGAFSGLKNVGGSVVSTVSTGISYINPLDNNFLGGLFNLKRGGGNGSDDLGQFK